MPSVCLPPRAQAARLRRVAAAGVKMAGRAILLRMSNAKIANEVRSFGRLADGTEVQLYTVRSGNMVATFSDYGARVVSVTVPDAAGKLDGVVLGYDEASLYEQDKSYQGAIVGRFGNRIAGGRFSLDGRNYTVPQNDGGNALHGGAVGFDQKVWTGTAIARGVEFRLVSPDGDQGFPGTLHVLVRYTLEGGGLRIEYELRSDADTVVNVTNHSYFNLAGDGNGTILEHLLMMPAESYTPIDATIIPTGEIAPVAGTAFDFRQATPVGERVDEKDVQLERAGGYDHNWVFGQPGVMKTLAVVHDPASGRTLKVESTEPGVQFYCGNFMGNFRNRAGDAMYAFRGGFCLETQHYPNSPNEPSFPSTVLQAGKTYRSETVYHFSVK